MPMYGNTGNSNDSASSEEKSIITDDMVEHMVYRVFDLWDKSDEHIIVAFNRDGKFCYCNSIGVGTNDSVRRDYPIVVETNLGQSIANQIVIQVSNSPRMVLD